MGWAAIIIAVVAIILALVLAPKAAQHTPPEFEELDVPTAEEGRPIPVVFGTFTVKSTNTVWYGDIAYEPILSDSGGK